MKNFARFGVVALGAMVFATTALAQDTDDSAPSIDQTSLDTTITDDGAGDQSTVDDGAGDEGAGDAGAGDEGAGDAGAGDEGAGDESTGDESTGDESTGDESTGDDSSNDDTDSDASSDDDSDIPVEKRVDDEDPVIIYDYVFMEGPRSIDSPMFSFGGPESQRGPIAYSLGQPNSDPMLMNVAPTAQGGGGIADSSDPTSQSGSDQSSDAPLAVADSQSTNTNSNTRRRDRPNLAPATPESFAEFCARPGLLQALFCPVT